MPVTRLEQLESDIKALSPEELATFRVWFQEYLADEWDKQIESDARAGKLDRLANEALAEHAASRTTPL
jgi:hypothetical protein